MMKRPIFAFLLVLGLAAVASAQSTTQYSNAPTDQGYRMTIIEPKAGATIVGKDVSIILGLPQVPPGNKPQSAASDRKQAEMNTPVFQIWVDGKDMGNLPGGTNVFYARDLSYGPHKIVVMAKNTAGELVDRKEISITTAETAGNVSVSQSATAPAPTMEIAPAPAPAPAPVIVETAPAPPAPVYTSLPHTATAYPRAAAAGLALVGLGIALRSKA
jgi:hypothetical protein